MVLLKIVLEFIKYTIKNEKQWKRAFVVGFKFWKKNLIKAGKFDDEFLNDSNSYISLYNNFNNWNVTNYISLRPLIIICEMLININFWMKVKQEPRNWDFYVLYMSFDKIHWNKKDKKFIRTLFLVVFCTFIF